MLQYSISSEENQGRYFGVSFKTIKLLRSLKRSLVASSTKDRALSQTMPPENEVEESVPDKIYTIDSTELPSFSCPAGHYIGIVNSYIFCNSKDFDVFEETWAICRNKTNCVLDASVFKNCTDKNPKFKNLQYSCFKIQAFDCGLFYPYDKKDEEFCLSLCRYYMRDCTAKYDQVPREYFVQCLEKMFFRNVSSQCGFLPNSIDPEHASFSWNKYMKKKYYHDNPNVTNKQWKTRKFKNKIENPVVFTSIPQDYGGNLKVLVKNVTNVNFKIRFLFMECDKKCFEKDGEVSEKVEYLAVSHGNHSSDMKNQIIVGSIQSETNSIVKLPLDPSLEWVVITQIQNDSLRTTSDVLPVIYTSLLHFNKRYFVDFYVNSKPEVKSVVLGYLAISKNEFNSSSLYQTELKYLQIESRHLDKVAVNISLGFNFDPKSIFGITTYESTLVADVRQSVNDLYTAGAIRSPYSSILKRYNIQVGFRWIAKTRTINKGPRLDVLFVEKSNFTTIKQICMFTRRLNYRSKRSCYSECISSLYLRECLIGEIGEFLNCYKERSQNCEIIELEGLNEFINENKDSILSYYRNKSGKKPVDDTVKVETKKEDEKKPEETVPVEQIVDEEIPHLAEIYSEWSSWSKCSSVCDDGINKAYESRTRLIYAESNSDYESEIMEKRDCADLVECDKLCYYRKYNETKEDGEGGQDAGNDSQSQTLKMFFFIWNPDCKMKPEDFNVNRKLTETQVSVENKVDYSKECESDYNWSACDAPCESDLQTKEPQRHLLINIKCESNVKKCDNLKKCVFSNSNGPKQNSIASYADIVNKYENEMCLLYSSLYDDSSKSWTNNGSCKCPTGTVPCNSNEIYFNKNNQHILNDNYSYINSLNETRLYTDASKYRNRSINKIQKYISLADNENIVMPFKYVKVLTYDKFASDEKLANFCSTGNIHFEKIPDNLLLINCNNMYSEPDTSVSNVSGSQQGKAITTDDCKNVCKQVERRCKNMHNKLDQKEVVECFIDKISRKTNLLEQPKTLEAIKLVDKDDKLVGALCALNKSNNRCKELATNAVYDCKNMQHHRNVNIKTRQCILDHYNKPSSSKSGQNCKFKRRKVIGSGLVFCKHIKCNYTKYSEWFQNTVKHGAVADKNNNTNIATNGSKMNLFNSVKLQIINDLMKKGIKNGITNDVINEIVKGLNVGIKIRIRYRNQTNNDPYCNDIHQLIQILTSPIIDNLESVPSFVDTSGTKSRWNNFSNRSSIIISESDYMDSLVAKQPGIDKMKGKDASGTESSSKIFNKDIINRNCNIYLGQKQLQNTKLIIQTNRCSCPSNTHLCSIEESLNSKRWIKLLDLVCLNKMRSVLFSNSGNFYRFSCLSKSFIKEDFESIKQLCNEDDEMTFISCYGEPTLIEVYIVATLMGIIGVISSILLIIYISKRRSLIKFR